MTPHSPLIFLHIPKTAGTTFKGVLDRAYPDGGMYELYGDIEQAVNDFRNLPEDRRGQIDCLRGHVGFGLHTHLPGSATYVTFLRDPVDRVISHYYYVRRAPWHRLHEAVTRDDVSLSEYVDLADELSNGQAKLIAGCEDLDDADRLFERARTNLERYFAVTGITERFDKSLTLMARTLSWNNAVYRKKNVTAKRPRKEDVASDVCEKIERHNRVDRRLYELAVDRLEKQIAAAGPGFAWEKRQLQARSLVYAKYRGLRSAAGRLLLKSRHLVRSLFAS